MSLGLLLLFGHITVMVSAIVVSRLGPSLMFQCAQRMGNVAMLRALATPTWIGVSIPILYVVGGLLGLRRRSISGPICSCHGWSSPTCSGSSQC